MDDYNDDLNARPVHNTTHESSPAFKIATAKMKMAVKKWL